MNSLSENEKGKQLSEESSENLTVSSEESRSTEPSEINLESPCALLTIFYAGKVTVYNVPADKAKAIMVVASRISGTPSSSASTPTTPSTPITPFPSAQTIKRVSLPTSPKFSIQRFLEKRNERLQGGKAPYSPSLPR